MKILFQGDSITDCHRKREIYSDLGEGYVVYTVDNLKKEFPEIDFEFLNRGISGNRTEDLLARLDEDLIALQPDIVTILIGVNDTWHRFSHYIETTAEMFLDNYDKILRRVKSETNAKIIILEPFLLYNMEKDMMRSDLDEKIDRVRQLALEYADAFVPLDALFVAANLNGIPNESLSPDGVHPGEEGKRLIANALTPVLSKFIKDLSE